MSLEYPSSWRFEESKDVIVPDSAIDDFFNIIVKIGAKGDRRWCLEHFKCFFASAAGEKSYESSSESWAETDLRGYMLRLATNPPLFLEAFYDACEDIQNNHTQYHVPGVQIINNICISNNIKYKIDPANLIDLSEGKASVSGVPRPIKNLIFAADGPKPDLVLSDALDNTIEIVENADKCLVYDLPIPQTGLLWTHLVEWWAKKHNLPFPEKSTEHNLFFRLEESLSPNSPPEILLFETYFKHFHRKLGERLPALVPQVYLHYDPKTLKQLKERKPLPRQRMDFLILFSNSERVVIEVDGKHHYADGDKASPQKYSEMVAEDRKLRLQGYEVYRFGGYELREPNGQELIASFFEQLFKKHGVM
jgi:very-short-patch-repair endonuclease